LGSITPWTSRAPRGLLTVRCAALLRLVGVDRGLVRAVVDVAGLIA
jgi:hypothetical protein